MFSRAVYIYIYDIKQCKQTV